MFSREGTLGNPSTVSAPAGLHMSRRGIFFFFIQRSLIDKQQPCEDLGLNVALRSLNGILWVMGNLKDFIQENNSRVFVLERSL